MILSQNIHKGVVLKLEGQLYVVVGFQHVNPGKGGAFIRTRLKNVSTGAVQEKTIRSGEKLENAEIDKRRATYSYSDGDSYIFIDSENYEQYSISADEIGDDRDYLLENMKVEIELYEGRPISYLLPNFVNLKITQTEPGVKGDTVSGSTKPAVLETGATVQVPLFVGEGEVIKVDTRTGEYVERV